MSGAAVRPVRVLIACDHIDFDGALHGGGRQLIELTRALDRARVAPTVCMLRAATPLGRQLQAEGLPFRFFGDGRFSPRSLLRLVRLIRAQRIQVLHLTDFGACTWGRLAGWLTGVPVIVQIITHHSEYTHRGYPKYVELAYRALAPLTARALAISESVRRFARERMGFRDAQLEVLYYPLPEHSFRGAPPARAAALRAHYGIGADEPVVGAVTRFFAVKGIRHLVEAFAEIRRAEPRAWLVLVGRGPEEAALRERARALGVADRVVFAGFQREVEAHVQMFDVAAVPSLEEAFGLVAVEAMALGTPVVASDVDGLNEVVTNGVSGLLAPPADPPALARAVLRVLRDPALRARLVAGGHDTARRFSLERYVGRLTELYTELAAAPGRASARLTPTPVAEGP
ncbi:MAG TPA: glycosyltransferase family 4 protein [Gemmatimonadales bacterium]|nr:glycosyltransferase family 4 protein [Gemmatimonadales bacterium]